MTYDGLIVIFSIGPLQKSTVMRDSVHLICGYQVFCDTENLKIWGLVQGFRPPSVYHHGPRVLTEISATNWFFSADKNWLEFCSVDHISLCCFMILTPSMGSVTYLYPIVQYNWCDKFSNTGKY